MPYRYLLRADNVLKGYIDGLKAPEIKGEWRFISETGRFQPDYDLISQPEADRSPEYREFLLIDSHHAVNPQDGSAVWVSYSYNRYP
jgi:hypothetical protein